MRPIGDERIHRTPRRRWVASCAALAFAVVTPSTASATPAESETRRASVRSTVDALPPSAGIERLAKEGYRLKDPLLLLDSGQKALARSIKTPDTEALFRARTHTTVAIDMLVYLQKPRVKSRWTPVESAQLATYAASAAALLHEIEGRIEEIRRKRSEALRATNEPSEKTGKGSLASGAVLTSIGISGAALGLTGALLGRQAQKKIDDPSIYGSTWDEWNTKGRNANLMALVGAGAAVAGLAIGIPLIVSGTKAKRRAGQRESAATSLRIAPQPQGLVVMGRF